MKHPLDTKFKSDILKGTFGVTSDIYQYPSNILMLKPNTTMLLPDTICA